MQHHYPLSLLRLQTTMFTETKHIIQLRFNSVSASAIASISLLCLLCARLNFYSLTFIYEVFHCFSSARWLYSLHILFILHSLFFLLSAPVPGWFTAHRRIEWYKYCWSWNWFIRVLYISWMGYFGSSCSAVSGTISLNRLAEPCGTSKCNQLCVCGSPPHTLSYNSQLEFCVCSSTMEIDSTVRQPRWPSLHSFWVLDCVSTRGDRCNEMTMTTTREIERRWHTMRIYILCNVSIHSVMIWLRAIAALLLCHRRQCIVQRADERKGMRSKVQSTWIWSLC